LFSAREIEIGTIPWIAFLFSLVHNDGPKSPVKTLEKKVSPSMSKHTNNSKEMAFLLVLCSNIRIQGTHLMHVLECPDLEWCDECDVSILMNNGISMWQHFMTDSYDRTAWARQIMHLCSSCFRSRHSFCPVTSSTSGDCSTASSTGKILGGVSHWWFNGNKELYHSRQFVMTITGHPIVRPCCSGAICQKYVWLHT
jgi:hypothetical protein